jgi:hypothetical protein
MRGISTDIGRSLRAVVGTADPKRVIAAVKREKQTLESVHLEGLCMQRALRCRRHLAPRGLREIDVVLDVSPMAIHRLNARGGIVNG